MSVYLRNALQGCARPGRFVRSPQNNRGLEVFAKTMSRIFPPEAKARLPVRAYCITPGPEPGVGTKNNRTDYGITPDVNPAQNQRAPVDIRR